MNPNSNRPAQLGADQTKRIGDFDHISVLVARELDRIARLLDQERAA